MKYPQESFDFSGIFAILVLSLEGGVSSPHKKSNLFINYRQRVLTRQAASARGSDAGLEPPRFQKTVLL